MTIGKICRNPVITIASNASIQDAAKLMNEKKVGCVLVTKENEQEGTPVGILTDRDIVVRLVAKDADLKSKTVAEAMSKDLLTLNSDQGIKKAIEAMTSKGVRRAPVMENGKVTGITSIDDLLCMIAGELGDLEKLVEQQVASGKK